MFIRMIASKMGSADPAGLTTMLYRAGEKYDVPDALALVFLREKWAEEDKTLEGMIETKAETGAASPIPAPGEGKQAKRRKGR